MPGERPHPWPACEKNAGGSTTGAAVNRHSLRDGLHAYTQSPWCAGLSDHRHPRGASGAVANSHQRRGVRTLRLHVHAMPFVRTSKTRCGNTRPSLPAPSVVTIARNAPPCRDGMATIKHDF